MSVPSLCFLCVSVCRLVLWTRNRVLGAPLIAQLVNWRTVECVKTSLGRWFESGSKEIFEHLDLKPNEALRLKFS